MRNENIERKNSGGRLLNSCSDILSACRASAALFFVGFVSFVVIRLNDFGSGDTVIHASRFSSGNQ